MVHPGPFPGCLCLAYPCPSWAGQNRLCLVLDLHGRYLLPRSVGALREEQTATKVVFGVVLWGRERNAVPQRWREGRPSLGIVLFADKPLFSATRALMRGHVRPLRCAVGPGACQRFSDCVLSPYSRRGTAAR